jgi:hypothetical protein
MFKAAIRVNKITSIAQLRGATLHAERGDETSQARLREGAEPGAGLAWSKAAESDRDYLAAFKTHKAELGAGERKGAPLCMQALCVVTPEWVKAAGDLHDPSNPRNRALFYQAKSWAESWAGKGSVFGARLDLDEAGGAVVDLMISPVRTSRGKPVISTQKALVELKAATGERNEYSALQTSWADWSREHLDSQIERGTRRTITDRQHLTPETYGLVKDKARAEALQERGQASEVVRALHSASGMAPEAIDELRDLLLLQREIQAHKRAPKQYEPPMSEYLMEGPTNVALALSPDSDPWPHIDRTRRDAARVVEAGRRFGLGQDDDKKGYKAGQDFFPALIDRMHLTAVLAKCGEFCARAEAFVKNTIAQLRGLDQTALLDQDNLWPENARPAVMRSRINLEIRTPVAQVERKPEVERERSQPTPKPERKRERERDSDFEL